MSITEPPQAEPEPPEDVSASFSLTKRREEEEQIEEAIEVEKEEPEVQVTDEVVITERIDIKFKGKQKPQPAGEHIELDFTIKIPTQLPDISPTAEATFPLPPQRGGSTRASFETYVPLIEEFEEEESSSAASSIEVSRKVSYKEQMLDATVVVESPIDRPGMNIAAEFKLAAKPKEVSGCSGVTCY